MISPLIKWDHSTSWNVPKVEQFSAGGKYSFHIRLQWSGSTV